MVYRRVSLTLTFVLGVLLAATAVPPAAEAQQAGQEIAESRQRLQQIRAEQERLRAEMSQVRTRADDLTGELQNLEHQRAAAAELLEELDFQIEATDSAIIETTRELSSVRDRLDEMQAVLDRRLREIYKRGPLHTVQVILAADSFSDLLNRYKYLHLIARQDRRLVQDISRMQTDLTLRQRRLGRDLSQLEALREERLREHTELEAIEEERRRTLAALRSQERTAAERIQQLARDERQLESLIATLEERRRAAERAAAERAPPGRAPARTESTITTGSLGSLGWPVEGNIIYRFGRENRPGGGTVRWNGLGIAADRGTPVRAVETGTVVLAAPFEGYGPSVILDHGGGYYSLYLYLDEVRVSDGARIQRGQPVGTVGGRGPPDGPHIEFQIRGPGGEALDPLRWLQQRAAR